MIVPVEQLAEAMYEGWRESLRRRRQDRPMSWRAVPAEARSTWIDAATLALQNMRESGYTIADIRTAHDRALYPRSTPPGRRSVYGETPTGRTG